MSVDRIKILDVTHENLAWIPCCGIKNTRHEGRRRKATWLAEQLKLGLRGKVMLTEAGRQIGYIEYIPGRHASRGIEADDYMVIHCVWILLRQYQKKGYATLLVNQCIEDAREGGMSGVAVLTRCGPWLVHAGLFLKLGFQIVDSAPPDYELLIKKFQDTAATPRLKMAPAGKHPRYASGLTVIQSDQCPYAVGFAAGIVQAARDVYRLEPRSILVNHPEAAQSAPTPYAVFSVLLDGQVVADHQISQRRFLSLMSRAWRNPSS